MEDRKWSSPGQLQRLLSLLVSWDSRTGTRGEIEFPHKLRDTLKELRYFADNPSRIWLHDAGRERNALTALYHSGKTAETIVLMSHFDTVHTEEFGTLEELAFHPELLTSALKERIDSLPKEAQVDLKSGDYLFGRGTMDMKMGLALHMHLLEKASTENWPINLLLLTVPDEEVNSAGMRSAVKGLTQLREAFGLHYSLFLNSEPSFSQRPNDDNYYIYSGSIGKMMPSALFYGRETHAGEPLNGLTSHYMASCLTQAMEFNEDFTEKVFGEETPLPICLQTNDLKQDYSVQTSHHSYALYNVFVMKRNARDIMDIFKRTAEAAMARCERDYLEICDRKGVAPIGKMKVLKYEELVSYAKKELGDETVQELVEEIRQDRSLDDRELSIAIADRLMFHAQELSPAVILFFAPPYYPAVNASDNTLVQDIIKFAQETLQENFHVEAKNIHYFNGISDLSYVNYSAEDNGWQAYRDNTPVWGNVYSIPFEEMQTLKAPVVNIGPFGKDAHKLTERLHKNSAFVHTPYVLRQIVASMFCEEANR